MSAHNCCRDCGLYQPTPDELTSWAQGFIRLADNIQDSKRQNDVTAVLRKDMCEIYPATAGKLLSICLKHNAFFSVIEGSTIPCRLGGGVFRLPALSYTEEGIADLHQHIQHVSGMPDEDESADLLRGLHATLWFMFVRERLVRQCSARFRDDALEIIDARLGHHVPSRNAAERIAMVSADPRNSNLVSLRAYADIHAEACRKIADLMLESSRFREQDRREHTDKYDADGRAFCFGPAVRGNAETQATKPVMKMIRLTDIPPLSPASGEWIKPPKGRRLHGFTSESLRQHRVDGLRAEDGLSGIDSKGWMWRKLNVNSHVWYHNQSLPKA